MSVLTESDKGRMLREVFDSTKITLYCGLHNYFGPSKENAEIVPAMGCANCWKIYLIHNLAETPPSKRDEVLTQLEETLRKCMELEDKSMFDFEPYLHPEISIEKE